MPLKALITKNTLLPIGTTSEDPTFPANSYQTDLPQKHPPRITSEHKYLHQTMPTVNLNSTAPTWHIDNTYHLVYHFLQMAAQNKSLAKLNDNSYAPNLLHLPSGMHISSALPLIQSSLTFKHQLWLQTNLCFESECLYHLNYLWNKCLFVRKCLLHFPALSF